MNKLKFRELVARLYDLNQTMADTLLNLPIDLEPYGSDYQRLANICKKALNDLDRGRKVEDVSKEWNKAMNKVLDEAKS